MHSYRKLKHRSYFIISRSLTTSHHDEQTTTRQHHIHKQTRSARLDYLIFEFLYNAITSTTDAHDHHQYHMV